MITEYEQNAFDSARDAANFLEHAASMLAGQVTCTALADTRVMGTDVLTMLTDAREFAAIAAMLQKWTDDHWRWDRQ